MAVSEFRIYINGTELRARRPAVQVHEPSGASRPLCDHATVRCACGAAVGQVRQDGDTATLWVAEPATVETE